MKSSHYYRSVKWQSFAGLAVTISLGGMFVLANCTSWAIPAPTFCGVAGSKGEWDRVKANKSYKELKKGEKLVCVDEIVTPYSAKSGSITVGIRIVSPDGRIVTKETNLFVARNFGPTKFNDAPGDWIVYQTNTYNPFGILESASSEPHTSWSSKDLSPEIEVAIWRMVQLDVAPSQVAKRHSLSRFLGSFLSLNALNLTASLLLLYSIVLTAQSILQKRKSRLQPSLDIDGAEKIRQTDDVKSPTTLALSIFGFAVLQKRKNRLQPSLDSDGVEKIRQTSGVKSRTTLALTSFGFAVVIAGISGVAQLTNWLLPRPFLCRNLSAPPQLAKAKSIQPLEVCFHEIHSLPHKELKTAELGVSFHYGNVNTYSLVRFFIALPSDKMGFQDVPGSWHFLNTSYFNDKGFLIKKQDQIVTSWMGSDVPQYYDPIVWRDVAYGIQRKYQARRLSVGSKFAEISESYLSLILAVLVGLWTCIKFVELVEIKYDLLQVDD